jgi:hypothetical protein
LSSNNLGLSTNFKQTTSSAIAKVRSLKVTAENPPCDDLDDLDFHRCATLHNTIVEHGWTASDRAMEGPGNFSWRRYMTGWGSQTWMRRLHTGWRTISSWK